MKELFSMNIKTIQHVKNSKEQEKGILKQQ